MKLDRILLELLIIVELETIFINTLYHVTICYIIERSHVTTCYIERSHMTTYCFIVMFMNYDVFIFELRLISVSPDPSNTVPQHNVSN